MKSVAVGSIRNGELRMQSEPRPTCDLVCQAYLDKTQKIARLQSENAVLRQQIKDLTEPEPETESQEQKRKAQEIQEAEELYADHVYDRMKERKLNLEAGE